MSLATGRAAADALRRRGYDVVEIDGDRALDVQLQREDVGVVFNALHGTFEMVDYKACSIGWAFRTRVKARSSLLGFDKGLAKLLYRQASVRWRPMSWFRRASLKFLCRGCPLQFSRRGQAGRARLERPFVLVQAPDQFRAALDSVGGGDVLIEAFVEGPEASVVVLGDYALGNVEIAAERSFYDYEAKYGNAGTQYTFLHVGVPRTSLKPSESALPHIMH